MIDEGYNSEINRVVDALLYVKKPNCKSSTELLHLLKNKTVEKKLRLKAFRFFSKVRDENFMPEFLKILQDQKFDNDLRSAAAEVLGSMKNKKVISDFREIYFLESGNLKLRGTLIRVLGELKAEEIIDDLLVILQNHSKVFQKLKNSYENQKLLTSMLSQELKIIEKAFSDLQAEKSVDKLIRLLNDKSIVGLVRETVICSIGEIISDESIIYLDKTIKRPDLTASERKAVITAIGNLRLTKAVPDLMRIFFEPTFSAQEHRAAIECLYKILDKEYFDEFGKLLRDRNFDINRRKLIAETIGKLQKVEAIDDLSALLNDPEENPGLQKTVIKALGRIQTPEAIEVLLKALLDESISEQIKLYISKIVTKSADNKHIFKLISLLNTVCRTNENFVIDEETDFEQKMEIASKALENISHKSYSGWIQNIIDFLSQKTIQHDIKKLCESLENNTRIDIKVRHAKLLFENVKQRKLPVRLKRNDSFSFTSYLSRLFNFVKAENN